jgi:GH15 family glucan-1,4-alpha-glucosidase
MPASLSAEHLGMVDQYFWDSFWSLAGLRSLAAAAGVLGKEKDLARYSYEQNSLDNDIRSAIDSLTERLGCQIIPATPTRGFDESAIGSIASVYPLQILTDLPHSANTVRELDRRFMDARGFFHPIIHSGYNPYLTLHLAHSYLLLKDTARAWEVAETIFRQAGSPYSLPEAIHPQTGGGSMGDGHHGWAAARHARR